VGVVHQVRCGQPPAHRHRFRVVQGANLRFGAPLLVDEFGEGGCGLLDLLGARRQGRHSPTTGGDTPDGPTALLDDAGTRGPVGSEVL
jgi:hypothetical protein